MSSEANTSPVVKGGRVWYTGIPKQGTRLGKALIVVVNIVSTLTIFALPIIACIALMPKLVNQSTSEYYLVSSQLQINDWRFLILGIGMLLFSSVAVPVIFFYREYSRHVGIRWKLRLFLGIKIVVRFLAHIATVALILFMVTGMGFATNPNQYKFSDWLEKNKGLESINITQLSYSVTYMKKDGELVEVKFSYLGGDKTGVAEITKPDLSSPKK